MKRVPLLLAAALVAATGLNVVLWSAFMDSSGHAGKLHGELERTKADLRQAQLDALIVRDQPSPEVFAPHEFLPTAEDPALVEVSPSRYEYRDDLDEHLHAVFGVNGEVPRG